MICSRRPRAHERRLYLGHVLAGRGRSASRRVRHRIASISSGAMAPFARQPALTTDTPCLERPEPSGSHREPAGSRQSAPGSQRGCRFRPSSQRTKMPCARLLRSITTRRCRQGGSRLPARTAKSELAPSWGHRDEGARFQSWPRAYLRRPAAPIREAALLNTPAAARAMEVRNLRRFAPGAGHGRGCRRSRDRPRTVRRKEYLRARGFSFDIVIVNEIPTSYRETFRTS